MQKGYKHTPETRERMRIASLKRDNTNRIKALPRGASHHGWAKEPNLLTLHKRIHRKLGKASAYPCTDCGGKARDWSLETTKYSDDPADYRARCRKCHVKRDGHSRNGVKVWEKLTRNKKGQFVRLKGMSCEHLCSGNCRRVGCNCECGEFHCGEKECRNEGEECPNHP